MNMYDRFVGVWRLNDWKMVRGSDILDPPIGPASECEGVLIYTPDRYMSVTISLRNRPHFATGSFDGGTDAEKRRAYETFFSYFGKCEVDEARKIMTHYVELSSYPNYVGRREERLYEFADHVLTLSVRSIKVGDQIVGSYLRWRKL